jgi:hypothetical protein
MAPKFPLKIVQVVSVHPLDLLPQCLTPFECVGPASGWHFALLQGGRVAHGHTCTTWYGILSFHRSRGDPCYLHVMLCGATHRVLTAYMCMLQVEWQSFTLTVTHLSNFCPVSCTHRHYGRDTKRKCVSRSGHAHLPGRRRVKLWRPGFYMRVTLPTGCTR